MDKKDMDVYTSRFTQSDINSLIRKYNIPLDLRPHLPPVEAIVSELPNNVIALYYRMFDFYEVRIPFSSFLLYVNKHFKVHFSQIGPLGLNKVITFQIFCRSLHIMPTVTLFKVFQTLCKQGHWFSFAKRRASAPVCIDDNRSCMKDWKISFFYIDRRVILDSMPWRHANPVITDPKPPAGSYDEMEV
ncbi:hypothetical protein Tco_1239605 [Tanacetum coccineum]